MTEEEWAAWKDNPTTKTFRRFLKKQISQTFEYWVAGSFTSPNGDQTLQLNSRAMGSAQKLQDLLELTAGEINKELSDE